MTLPQWIALTIAVLRAAELIYAHRNARRLLAMGGRTFGDRHYPAIVGLHAGWLVALLWTGGLIHQPDWLLFAFFVLLEAARFWVIATLGRFWTTRIVTVPGTPLVRSGPYGWVRHPNYLIVSLEVPLLLFAFAAPGLAVLFGAANILLLAHRIRVEDDALRVRRSPV
ncbi:MAG TPA: isoprenylcysteine carboxylmethyltransferase family protein [Alphaproteobacteria bacterium]|nr:isoprenylcysteine carboxylmethyltransferase family protein [Alphaproteobacteria bacterium]